MIGDVTFYGGKDRIWRYRLIELPVHRTRRYALVVETKQGRTFVGWGNTPQQAEADLFPVIDLHGIMREGPEVWALSMTPKG